MKKWMFLFLGVLLLAVLSIYIIIPGNINTIISEKVAASNNSIQKAIEKDEWNKMLGTTMKESNKTKELFFKNAVFVVNQKFSNAVKITINYKNNYWKSSLLITSLSTDTSKLNWIATTSASVNPVTRIRQYFTARQLKENMSVLLKSFKNYVSETKNIYGVHIDEIKLKDSLLISKKFTSDNYPSVDIIYSHINELNNFIAKHGAHTTDQPMLHVFEKAENSYEYMIGLPVDKPVNDSNDYILKHMPLNGKMLVAKAQGGKAEIKKAYKAIEALINDAQRTSPGIPYELLITNRQKETDTAKWITLIYYPII